MALILIAASACCVRDRAGFGYISVGLRCAKPNVGIALERTGVKMTPP